MYFQQANSQQEEPNPESEKSQAKPVKSHSIAKSPGSRDVRLSLDPSHCDKSLSSPDCEGNVNKEPPCDNKPSLNKTTTSTTITNSPLVKTNGYCSDANKANTTVRKDTDKKNVIIIEKSPAAKANQRQDYVADSKMADEQQSTRPVWRKPSATSYTKLFPWNKKNPTVSVGEEPNSSNGSQPAARPAPVKAQMSLPDWGTYTQPKSQSAAREAAEAENVQSSMSGKHPMKARPKSVHGAVISETATTDAYSTGQENGRISHVAPAAEPSREQYNPQTLPRSHKYGARAQSLDSSLHNGHEKPVSKEDGDETKQERINFSAARHMFEQTGSPTNPDRNFPVRKSSTSTYYASGPPKTVPQSGPGRKSPDRDSDKGTASVVLSPANESKSASSAMHRHSGARPVTPTSNKMVFPARTSQVRESQNDIKSDRMENNKSGNVVQGTQRQGK